MRPCVLCGDETDRLIADSATRRVTPLCARCATKLVVGGQGRTDADVTTCAKGFAILFLCVVFGLLLLTLLRILNP